MSDSIKFGILTVSDRATRGEYEDRGGPAIHDYLKRVIKSQRSDVSKMVTDDVPEIESALHELCESCCVVITTGGTGPAARDVTPEATESVCDKMMPGFGEAMRAVSLLKVPTAILSRQTAGICNASLIINLPGSPKAIAECLDAVFAAVPYCVDLVGGPFIETNDDHIVAFRPKHARRD